MTTSDLSPLQKAADIANRAKKLAEDWSKGASVDDVKERSWQLGDEIRNVHARRDEPDRHEVMNATKDVKLLIEAIRTANYSRGVRRDRLKTIISECIALTDTIAA